MVLGPAYMFHRGYLYVFGPELNPDGGVGVDSEIAIDELHEEAGFADTWH
jgi:hypothetical protein